MRTRSLLLPGPAALAALVLTVRLGMSPLKNFDLFFHLAGGQFVLKNGFTRVDPFSVTGTAGWVPHEWGFGVLCVGLIRLLGAAGPALLVAGLVALNLMLLWKVLERAASGRRGLLAVATLAALLVVYGPTWPQERPYHLGHLLFTLAVLAIQSWRAGNDRILWVFPFLGAIWANVHGSWLLGPALLGSTAVGQYLDERTPESLRRTLKAVGFSVAAFLAAGLGPDGINIYLYPIHHSLLASTQTIVEWRPLNLDLASSWAYLALGGAACFAVGQSRVRKVAILLPAFVLGLAAIKVQRHAPFAAVLLALALLEHAALTRVAGETTDTAVGAWKRFWGRVDAWTAGWSARAGGGLWPTLALLGLVVIHAQHPLPFDQGVKRSVIPIPVFEALRKHPPGKVLNPFVIGGPISFFAGADYKVFIDSRNDPFPMSIHEDYDKLVWGEPGWEDALARYDPDYLLWDIENPGNILLDNLRVLGGWREEARDGNYVLWIRERPTATGHP
ncbi:hypothetical protein OWM54_33885 [Myxococcus sp. MISCRS1]|uniref:hypothetical protein n=1 Tax=Myxococcus sp. MISCRS1 TaxID=2996786 RepID=UPI002270FBD7|nr:hypothetical protein [Myxococcus sp. MISCRS1]MCY1002155.1 hypothetical protein [Myxococcus sp. MISCRS1]BDT36272.1 hypothetical protein MFMH1_59410 [Myxococcus sp. MH1]